MYVIDVENGNTKSPTLTKVKYHGYWQKLSVHIDWKIDTVAYLLVTSTK